jgi:hypothetical protein
MASLEGIAVDGPRDGVKLSCPPNWDGRVGLPQQGPGGAATRYYPGRYQWLFDPTSNTYTWIWNRDRAKEAVIKLS